MLNVDIVPLSLFWPNITIGIVCTVVADPVMLRETVLDYCDNF
jgi:hypothetical protein